MVIGLVGSASRPCDLLFFLKVSVWFVCVSMRHGYYCEGVGRVVVGWMVCYFGLDLFWFDF